MDDVETVLEWARGNCDARRAEAEQRLAMAITADPAQVLALLLAVVRNPITTVPTLGFVFTVLAHYAHAFQSKPIVLECLLPFFSHPSAGVRHLAAVTYAVYARLLFEAIGVTDSLDAVLSQLPTAPYVEGHIRSLGEFLRWVPEQWAASIVSALLELLRCCGDAPTASILIDSLSGGISSVYSCLADDSAFDSFLFGVVIHFENPELKISLYKLFQNVADVFYSSISNVIVQLIEASAVDLEAKNPDLVLAVLNLWATISESELSREEFSGQFVFTAAPHLTAMLIAVFLTARERFEPTGSGEWDLDTAARLCLVRFARLAFAVVSDLVFEILSSCVDPIAGLELLHLLWDGGNSDFCTVSAEQSLDSIFQALAFPDRRLRRAGLQFLNSIVKTHSAPIIACIPILTGLLREEFTLAKLAVKGLVSTIARLPESDCHSMVLNLIRTFRDFPPPVAEEIFIQIGQKVLRAPSLDRSFCADLVNLLTDSLEFLVTNLHFSLAESVFYALGYALPPLKHGLAGIASRLWSVIESGWKCTQSCFALISLHSFAIADPAAFADFADAAFALVRGALLAPGRDLVRSTALAVLLVFALMPGRMDILQEIVALLDPVLSLDLSSRALHSVVDVCACLLCEPVSVPTALWTALLERIRVAIVVPIQGENGELSCMFWAVLGFLRDFCACGPRELIEAASGLIPEALSAIHSLPCVPEE
jgi:hypothetical protein